MLDGTYFHKDGCLIVFVDTTTGKPFYYAYVDKESYHSVLPLVKHLNALGVNPKVFTLDGHTLVIKALLAIWPDLIIQRCLFHIERQGLQWLRSFPKMQASQDLRIVLKFSGAMKTKEDMYSFLSKYKQWRIKYYQAVCSLPKTSSVNKDIKRTISLIDNALNNMFHFVKDHNIIPTTNYLENFFAQLKHRYRGHKGLSSKHKVAYLKWYCFYKNTLN
jgi:transposase-like protein